MDYSAYSVDVSTRYLNQQLAMYLTLALAKCPALTINKSATPRGSLSCDLQQPWTPHPSWKFPALHLKTLKVRVPRHVPSPNPDRTKIYQYDEFTDWMPPPIDKLLPRIYSRFKIVSPQVVVCVFRHYSFEFFAAFKFCNFSSPSLIPVVPHSATSAKFSDTCDVMYTQPWSLARIIWIANKAWSTWFDLVRVQLITFVWPIGGIIKRD